MIAQPLHEKQSNHVRERKNRKQMKNRVDAAKINI